MFYYCDCSGGIFQYPRIEREHHYEVDGNAYEEYEVCPSCCSDQIGEALKCEHCGEYSGKTTTIDEWELCGVCLIDLDKTISATLTDFADEWGGERDTARRIFIMRSAENF